MTPAAHKAAQAKARLDWLRHAAWGLNHTPHAQRLIEAWEHRKNDAERMMIPQIQKPSGTDRI